MRTASTALCLALLLGCDTGGGGGGTGGGGAVGGGPAGGGGDATGGGAAMGGGTATGGGGSATGGGGGIPQAAIGDPCARDADCGAGLECAPGAGGYCFQSCATAPCPTGAVCISGRVNTDGSPMPAVCMKECAGDGECRAGFKCEAPTTTAPAVCTQKCNTDDDCESGVCDVITGKCGQATIGAACTRSADCGVSLLCSQGAGIPGGYCTRGCGQTVCPGGSTCVNLGDSDAVCLLNCTDATQCRAGYGCFGGTCAASCASNVDCAFGKVCDTSSSRCVEAGPPARGIGAPCTVNTDCDSMTCFTEAATMVPGGMCTQSCETAACPGGSVCAGAGPNAVCTVPCAATSACRDGFACTTFQGTANVCAPQCTRLPSICEATETCLPSGLCVPTPPMAPAVSIAASTQPALNVPFVDDGASTPLVATVPDGGVSVQVVIDGPDTAGSSLRVSRITGPGGVLYQLGSLGQSQLKLNNSSNSGAMSVMVPNSPDVAFPPGDYQFEFASTRTGTVTVTPTVTLKTTTHPAITQASMDLTFVFVGAHAVISSAAQAQADADFQTMVNNFKTVFATAGITVGNIEYLDASAAVAAQHADLADGAIGDLMRTTAALPNERPTVFWVQSLPSGFVGFSAGIPGALKRGSGVSGVVMSLGDFPNAFDNPTRVGRTLAHEFGHWLGLFHINERAGTSFDPLSDTPECDQATYDTNGDQILRPSECLTAGADNLMFWVQDLAVVARDKISPNQKWVLLRNPAAR